MLSENAGRINDEDYKVNPNTLTNFNKKTEHASNSLHAYISVSTHEISAHPLGNKKKASK